MRPRFLLALLSSVLVWSSAVAEPPDQIARHAPSAEKTPAVDRYGDRLPAGAFARLGTVRFRVPGSIAGASWSLDGKALLVMTTAQKIHVLPAATGKTIEVFGFPARMEVSNVAIT